MPSCGTPRPSIIRRYKVTVLVRRGNSSAACLDCYAAEAVSCSLLSDSELFFLAV